LPISPSRSLRTAAAAAAGPELKAASGQEKLPTLELRDGTWVNGSGAIKAWAREQVTAAR
jgi:hypothetical protein